MSLLNIFKTAVLDTVRVEDCLPGRDSYLRFDKNERLIPFPDSSLSELRDEINSNAITAYMPLAECYEDVARHLEVKPTEILLTAGSELAIKSVFEATINNGDRIIAPNPCYAMTKIHSQLMGGRVISFGVETSWQNEFENIVQLIEINNAKVVVVEYPNALGQLHPFHMIESLAESLAEKNVLLLIDLAYYFTSREKLPSAAIFSTYPNCMYSVSFSKGHGVAGIRSGCLIGNSDVINIISRVRPIHEIPSLTAVATRWILRNRSLIDDYRRHLRESKSILYEGLKSLGLRYLETESNFVLIHFPAHGVTMNIADALRERRILIRRPYSTAESANLAGWSRVTVGSVNDVRKFLRILGEIINARNS